MTKLEKNLIPDMTTKRTIIPKTRLAVATIALPVPRSLVGNSSGETAYKTPYMILLVNVYPQFHPRSALDVLAVVPPNKKTSVRTEEARHDQ